MKANSTPVLVRYLTLRHFENNRKGESSVKFVPKEKMSKRDRSALNKQKRAAWSISPITRVKEDKTKYNRKRIRDYD